MNFDTSATAFFDTSLVGTVYEDDQEKLHSDLIGLPHPISMEDVVVEPSDEETIFAMKAMEESLKHHTLQNQVDFSSDFTEK